MVTKCYLGMSLPSAPRLAVAGYCAFFVMIARSRVCVLLVHALSVIVELDSSPGKLFSLRDPATGLSYKYRSPPTVRLPNDSGSDSN